MATTKKENDINELTEMDVRFVSLVTAGANRQNRFLMVKTGNLLNEVPVADAAPEIKKAAQEARSIKYRIEVLKEGSNLSFPSDAPSDDNLYGDPVNLLYPMASIRGVFDKELAIAAVQKLRDDRDTYEKEQSLRAIYTRIAEKVLSEGATMSFDPADELDNLLPASLREGFSKNTNDQQGEAEVPDEPEPSTDDNDTDGQVEQQEREAEMGSWLDSTMGELSDQLLDARISDAQRSAQSAVGKSTSDLGTGSSVSLGSEPKGSKLEKQVETLERENAAVRRALKKNEEALRREALKYSRLRNGAIGGASALITGEVAETRGAKHSPVIDEADLLVWRSGGDLSANVK